MSDSESETKKSGLKPIPLHHDDAMALIDHALNKAGAPLDAMAMKNVHEMYTRARYGDYETPMNWSRAIPVPDKSS